MPRLSPIAKSDVPATADVVCVLIETVTAMTSATRLKAGLSGIIAVKVNAAVKDHCLGLAEILHVGEDIVRGQ